MTETILISGAGSGIGRAMAIDLAKNEKQYQFILLGRNIEALEETKNNLKNNEQHIIVSVSQSDQKALKTALENIDLKSKNLTGLIANAGLGGENIYGDGDRWEEVITTNLSGTYYLINECLPALKQTSDSYKNIIIISSILARLGVPEYTAYCASKAGLLGLMRSLAVSLASDKILVNAICPGWVDTKMARQGIEHTSATFNKNYDEVLKMHMKVVPTGKMSNPEEVASLATYLLSDKQTSFTGQSFDINNGAIMP